MQHQRKAAGKRHKNSGKASQRAEAAGKAGQKVKPGQGKHEKKVGPLEVIDGLTFVNDRFMLVLTIFLAVAYYIYSAVSDGMYQHDEAGHFINMRDFWHDPASVLGNWAKLGYKLIYVIPALFGEGVVTVMNCFMAAFTAFFTYKVVSKLGGKFGLLAFLLLAAQPMWIQLSFRNYSEITTAFLLVLSLFFLFNRRLILAAFILSYICLIRQEFYLVLAIFGIYLLIQRNFKAILVAAMPPLFYNLFGWLAKGDPLYLVNQVLDTSSTYGDAYPRQGLDHYPLVAEMIFGITAILLFFLYVGTKIIAWKKINWFILLPAVLFFVLHTLFNSQSLDFGPSSGGNHRYMAVIAPLLASMGALSIDQVIKLPKRYRIAFVIVPVLLITGFFWTFEPDGIHLGDTRDWRPLIIASGVAIMLLLPVRNSALITAVIALLSVFSTIQSIEPIPNSSENETMEEVVKWYQMEVRRAGQGAGGEFQITEETPILSQHALFFYYQDKTEYDFFHPVLRIDSISVDTADIGTLILWDSHYSYRPNLRSNTVNDQYFLDRPTEFRLLNTFQSEDNFNVKAFMKIGRTDPQFNQAMKLFDAEEFTQALDYFIGSANETPQNPAAWYFAGACFQQQQDFNMALAYYNRSLSVDPDFPKALNARGRLWAMAGQLERAMQDYERFIQLHPRDPAGYFGRGGVYFGMNKFEEAINDYAVVAKLAPSFAQTYYNVGLAQVQLGQQQSACVNFNKALELGYAQAEQALKQHCGMN